MASPPLNACRNPQDNRAGGGVLPNASSQHSGIFGWFEGAYSRTVSAAETAYHDVAGAVDYGYHATTKAIEAGYTVASDELRSWINSIPEHISQAASWDQLRYWAEIALGGECFEVGVCVGMVKNLADGVWGLLQMLKMFVLAGLYEQAHASSEKVAAAVSPQTYLIAKAADLVLGAQMKEADQQARALVKELEHLMANPGQLLTALGQKYKQKWERFWELSKQNTLTGKFQAGEIVGDVLMDIIMLIQLAEGAVELASKIPKLLAEAEKVAAEAPEIASAARELGTVKKLESVEDAAKAAEDSAQSVEPLAASSDGIPGVSEAVPALSEEKPPALTPPTGSEPDAISNEVSIENGQSPDLPSKQIVQLKYKDGWTPEQMAEADRKIAYLNEQAQQGKAVVSGAKRSGTSARDLFEEDIPEGKDIDHKLDIQLGGSETDPSNLWPLDSSVNRSLGAQISNQIKDLPVGTPINEFAIEQ